MLRAGDAGGAWQGGDVERPEQSTGNRNEEVKDLRDVSA